MSYQLDNDVLPHELWGKANSLIKDLSKDQLLWLGGYLSGVGLSGTDEPTVTNTTVVASGPVAQQAMRLTVLFGSHSGNSKLVAARVAEVATQEGRQVNLVSMADYKLKQLKDESQLIVVVSTHGEGEPPVVAEELHRLLDGKRAGNLEKLEYAVIALGDSTYLNFCQTGLDFHERLRQRGASALADPLLLDLDFKDQLREAASSIVTLFKNEQSLQTTQHTEAPLVVTKSDDIVEAEVLDKVLLNGRGSAKETYHVELSLEESGLTYQPGDALEVFAFNDEKLVEAILSKLNLKGEALVKLDDKEVTLKQALIQHRELTVVTLPVLKKLSAFVEEAALNILLDNREALIDYFDGTDLLDVITDYPVNVNPQQLVDALRKLPPRAYSIASSREEVGEEVHLTVGAVRYQKDERQRHGVCSTFIADALEPGQKVKVRVKNNEGFRLPKQGETPVIMIGPGTGVAPFRSFIQERDARNAAGKNWLLFGDQHFESDFLYQAEWLKYRQQGVLAHLDVAFSRDQEQKIYVQHRLKQKAGEVWTWLQEGAHIYVCGDRQRMAGDVKQAFLEILQEQGGLTSEEADQQVLEWRQNHRYQEDVY